MSIETLVHIQGHRWFVEDDFEVGKNEKADAQHSMLTLLDISTRLHHCGEAFGREMHGRKVKAQRLFRLSVVLYNAFYLGNADHPRHDRLSTPDARSAGPKGLSQDSIADVVDFRLEDGNTDWPVVASYRIACLEPSYIHLARRE